MAQPAPFTLRVDEQELLNLKRRLKLARWPMELSNAGWERGAPLADVRRLAQRWAEDYDWRAAEARINKLPMYTLPIEVNGFDVMKLHFVHARSKAENAIPLLFAHGWPGHFLEAEKIIPLLTQPAPDGKGPSFHVVAPSLPGFGFSEGPSKAGFRVAQYAEAYHKIMIALGYHEYVTQGGDWGFFITRKLALDYPHAVKAWHTNYPRATPPSIIRAPWNYFRYLFTPYTEAEKDGLERTKWYNTEGNAYLKLQATRPQTLGYSLADSPVGLLAWIYEKLVEWTDDYPWTDDEILTWVSIYYFSTCGPSQTLHVYYEAFNSPTNDRSEAVHVPNTPLGVSRFPQDLVVYPASCVRAIGNIVFERWHKKGGHFAAHEQPEALVRNLREMFGSGGIAAKAVAGANRRGD